MGQRRQHLLHTARPVDLATLVEGQLGMGALPVIAAVIAGRHHSPARTGLLVTAVAVGSLLGSLAWTAWPLPARHAPLTVMGALVATGTPLLVAGGTTSLPAIAGLFAVAGLFTGPFTGALFTTRQDHAPDHLRSQVFTIGAGLKTSAAAAGAAVAGALSPTPTGTQLLLAGACPVVAGAVGVLLLARHQRGDQRMRDTTVGGTERADRRA